MYKLFCVRFGICDILESSLSSVIQRILCMFYSKHYGRLLVTASMLASHRCTVSLIAAHTFYILEAVGKGRKRARPELHIQCYLLPHIFTYFGTKAEVEKNLVITWQLTSFNSRLCAASTGSNTIYSYSRGSL